MITIHLTGGIRAADDDLPYFKQMMATIYRNDATLAHNWIESAVYGVTEKNERNDEVDWNTTVHDNTEAIKRADLVIIEITAYRLFHGYEMMTALQHNKPVLLVSRKSLRESAISGFKHDNLTMEVYSTLEQLDEIITKFIHANWVPKEKLNFGVTVSRALYSELDRIASSTGKARHEVLVDLATKYINERK